jgi:hypothetical protein
MERLEATHDLLGGFALLGAPLGVDEGTGIVAQAGQGDDPQGVVGLAVPAAVEAVADGLARGRHAWRPRPRHLSWSCHQRHDQPRHGRHPGPATQPRRARVFLRFPSSAWRSCAAMMLAGSLLAAIAEASAWRSMCVWAFSPTLRARLVNPRLAWLG